MSSRLASAAQTPRRRDVLRASVTPLASIFGSGFLIIVPILERSLGRLAAFGMAAVCGLAWLVGMAIRHNVVATEGVDTHATTRRLERASDLVIVVAYVISVALYLRILAQFVVGYVSSGSGAAERILAVAIVGLITLVGVVRVCTPCRRSSGSRSARSSSSSSRSASPSPARTSAGWPARGSTSRPSPRAASARRC